MLTADVSQQLLQAYADVFHFHLKLCETWRSISFCEHNSSVPGLHFGRGWGVLETQL